MKLKDIVFDSATVVGCCVGVGFLSGKEAQYYFGNNVNVLIFALLFFVANVCLRLFCQRHKCFDVASLSRCCFGNLGNLFTVLFLLCCFVCVVTVLAGVQNCLAEFVLNTKLPLFSILTATISFVVLKKGMNALKWLNMISIALSLLYLLLIAVTTNCNFETLEVSPIQPLKYTLFSVTMSLGVLAPLSNSNKQTNIAASVFASLGVFLLMYFVIYVADFSLQMPLIGKTDGGLQALCAVTMILCTVTGVVANALPILQSVKDIFGDDDLCCTCILSVAVAFSMFGFDFLLNYGYLFVASIGTVLYSAIAVNSLKKTAL